MRFGSKRRSTKRVKSTGSQINGMKLAISANNSKKLNLMSKKASEKELQDALNFASLLNA